MGSARHGEDGVDDMMGADGTSGGRRDPMESEDDGRDAGARKGCYRVKGRGGREGGKGAGGKLEWFLLLPMKRGKCAIDAPRTQVVWKTS